MSALSTTSCCLHELRPAAARCPGCRRFFCAECITEHDGRLRCAQCLTAERQADESASSNRDERTVPARRWWATLFQAALAVSLCWVLYYSVARLLMAIPADFHDGTLWEE